MNATSKENSVLTSVPRKRSRFCIESLEERIAPDSMNGAINENDGDIHFIVTPSGNIHTMPG